MKELIVLILMNLGITFSPGNHYRISSKLAEQIRTSQDYDRSGGESEFLKSVTVIDNSTDDIVITDDDNPLE